MPVVADLEWGLEGTPTLFWNSLVFGFAEAFKNYSCQKTLGVHSIDRWHRATSIDHQLKFLNAVRYVL